jgi:hypothetical protein
MAAELEIAFPANQMGHRVKKMAKIRPLCVWGERSPEGRKQDRRL